MSRLLSSALLKLATCNLMVGGVKQNFVQAAAIEDFATFGAPREVLFFFRRKRFVIVEGH